MVRVRVRVRVRVGVRVRGMVLAGTRPIGFPKRRPRGVLNYHAVYLVAVLSRITHLMRGSGYEEFNPPSWPGSCAPNKADWINEVVGQCGDGDAYPEEFWNCADIEISAGEIHF